MIWKTLEQRIYNPYSEITQSAVLKGESGKFYAGVRIENLSFPLTMDAVAVAFSSCLSEGDRPAELFMPAGPDRLAESWCAEFRTSCTHGDPPHGDLFDPVVPKGGNEPLALLKKTVERAHVPNSDFRVAALIETDEGYITGANIETEAWVNGLCAERVALAKTIAAGINAITAIHIFAPKADFLSPCGACRQVLIEHMQHHPVLLYYNDGTIAEYFTSHLLPFHFNSAWLKRKKRT
jgi:homotetrameric cytidine deaminase